MAEFSLELNEDQLQIQKWVHDFAENVIRPAAHEWDEREETPWPIIEEAARIGLYSFDFISQCFFDPSGLLLPIANEEMAWGDAGHRPGHLREHPRARRHRRQRHARAADGVGSPVLRHARQDPDWPPSPCPRPTPAPTSPRCAPAPSTTRPRTSGSSTARRPGSPTAASPTSTWSWPRSTPSSARGARPASSCPPETPGSRPGPEVQEDGHPGLAHRRGRPRRRAGCPGHCLLGGKEKLDEQAGPGPRGQALDQPGGHGDLRGLPAGGRRPGARHRPGRLRVLARLRQGAQGLRSGHHREPGASPSSSPT